MKRFEKGIVALALVWLAVSGGVVPAWATDPTLDWAGATTSVVTAGSAAMEAVFVPVIGLFALLIGIKLLKKVANKAS